MSDDQILLATAIVDALVGAFAHSTPLMIAAILAVTIAMLDSLSR